MKKIVLLAYFFLFFYGLLFSQENNYENRGIIKVEKRGNLAKILFDNINYRLVGIDYFGNVIDTAVFEFQLRVTINGIFYSEKTLGSTISYKMRQLLGRCDSSTTIIFDKIKAKDQNGTVLNMPPLRTNFGYYEDKSD